MVGWPIRATGWPCKIFVLQNSWESFVIMERVRKSVAWRWKCLKQLTFELYWRRHWVPNINIKCSHHWSKHITIRWKSRDKERYSKNIFEHNMLRYRIYIHLNLDVTLSEVLTVKQITWKNLLRQNECRGNRFPDRRETLLVLLVF